MVYSGSKPVPHRVSCPWQMQSLSSEARRCKYWILPGLIKKKKKLKGKVFCLLYCVYWNVSRCFWEAINCSFPVILSHLWWPCDFYKHVKHQVWFTRKLYTNRYFSFTLPRVKPRVLHMPEVFPAIRLHPYPSIGLFSGLSTYSWKESQLSCHAQFLGSQLTRLRWSTLEDVELNGKQTISKAWASVRFQSLFS